MKPKLSIDSRATSQMLANISLRAELYAQTDELISAPDAFIAAI